MGRKIILYDLYKNDEYPGRYKAKELMYLLGMSRETIASRVYHGVKAKDGYEIMRAEPDGWAESWERVCAPLRRMLQNIGGIEEICRNGDHVQHRNDDYGSITCTVLHG